MFKVDIHVDMKKDIECRIIYIRDFLKWILKLFGFSKFKRRNMWPD